MGDGRDVTGAGDRVDGKRSRQFKNYLGALRYCEVALMVDAVQRTAHGTDGTAGVGAQPLADDVAHYHAADSRCRCEREVTALRAIDRDEVGRELGACAIAQRDPVKDKSEFRLSTLAGPLHVNDMRAD